MIVKVCGMCDVENIRQIDEIGGVEWMGFIFYPRSPRYVSTVPNYLPQHCKRVGVFVNSPIEEIAKRADEFGLDIVQLHGNENSEYIFDLRNMIGENIKIIKMVQIEMEDDIRHTEKYEGLADYFLFETRCKEYGGSGKQFDWDILRQYNGNVPFLITGGIGSEDADKVLSFSHPKFVGIDLNSRFEISPAVKDTALIDKFIKQIKNNEQN